MKALILAAGYATRLYPLTMKFPKPLLKIGSRPIIDYIVEKLSGLEEINEIIVVTNSKFISKFKDWAKKPRGVKPITLVDDRTDTLEGRRGAIGDMDFVIHKKRLKDDLLVIGGDNLFNDSLEKFMAFTKTRPLSPVIGAYDIKSRLKAGKYGVVRLDKKKRVVEFQEKPARPKSSLVAMCLYYFPKQCLCLVRQYLNSGRGKDDATGFYIDWLKEKQAVYGFIFKGRWYDIGNYDFYREAKKKFVR